MQHTDLIYKPGSNMKLSEFDTDSTGKYKNKKEAEKNLQKSVNALTLLQEKLYADDKHSVLLIFQAMDAAGKDGTIKHVLSGINPLGCQLTSFKVPSAEELDHDYLWRCVKQLPERGRIGVFNRSYYEEVLVTRVHPEFLTYQKLPNLPKAPQKNEKFWLQRYQDINNFEQYLTNNGTIIFKFFLHVSKEEQKQRLLERINDPTKNWKFSIKDVYERDLWENYMAAYEETLKHTSTECAPWHVIPADKKWFMRAAVSEIIIDRLERMKINYPKLTATQKTELTKAKGLLTKLSK